MPGRRMRRHFAQLSQFEKGLITALVDASCCSPSRSLGRRYLKIIFGAVDTRSYGRVENRIWSDKEDDETGESALVYSTVTVSFHDTIRCMAASCSTKPFPSRLMITNLQSKLLSRNKTYR
ncbi:hypothetical protein TNCT_583101 [Trichonephila clavata]|uniref:Uncharacterized protein n=1 Tax=Trichonephila clavata TaxID=2740835 RepID=A0A8X6JBQ2_TRICU|nr:hypothetical protein TNCT_583101 [Trichonephila clavata]